MARKETLIRPLYVVGVDGSPPSEKALLYAAEMAGASGARLRVVAVKDASMARGAVVAGAGFQAVVPEAAEASAEAIASAKAALAGTAVAVTFAILPTGDPARGLVRDAGRSGASLIIVGSHGRRGLARAVLGSVAERVVREAPCPVLVVR